MTTYAVLLILGAALGYSIMDLLRKLLTQHLSTMAVLFWMTLGSLPLFAVWAWNQPVASVEPRYIAVALVSMTLQVLANLAMIEALRRSPLSVTIPFLSLTPVFTAGFSALLIEELPTVRQGLGILIVVCGVWWLARVSTSDGRPVSLATAIRSEPGVPLMIAVALMWSAAGPLDKMAMTYVPLPFHALVLNLGIAVVTLVILLARGRGREVLHLGSAGWLVVAMAATAAIALAFQLAAMQVTLVALVETLKRGINTGLALVLGAVVFGEKITPAKIAACALIVVGVLLIG